MAQIVIGDRVRERFGSRRKGKVIGVLDPKKFLWEVDVEMDLDPIRPGKIIQMYFKNELVILRKKI